MAKKEKIEKRNIKIKKLPGIFKKSYNEKKLNKKILRHIYIPSDKSYIEGLFEKGNNPKKAELFAISRELLFTKKELKKFKRLSKEIKSHKGRFNFGAIAAVFILLAGLCAVTYLFKDTAIKIGIRKTCESIFNAKTDIKSVKLDLLKSSLSIKSIAIGDSNHEFKNIFEGENITVDINIPQAFRGRFVAEQLSCDGMKFNTERKTSCKLPEKKKKEIKNNKQEKHDKNSSTVSQADNKELLNKKKIEAASLIKSNITAVLGSSDPEEIINNVMLNFKSPVAIEDSINITNQMIEKWESKPVEVANKVTDFYKSTVELSKIDVSKVPDVPTLMKDIELVKTAINKGNDLKNEIEIISNDIQVDFNSIQNMTASVNKAVKEDMDFASETLNSVKGIGKSAASIFENGLDSIGYEVMGKYYPYAQKAVGILNKLQNDNKSKTTPEKVKKTQKRMEGVTFNYGAEYPEFLIEKVYVSGENFTVFIEECTNNQNVRNKSMNVSLNFNVSEVMHNANLLVDARSKQNKETSVNISYDGNGFNTAIDGRSIAVKTGVPSLYGKTNIHLEGFATASSFSAGGSVVIPNVKLTSDGFDNDMLTKYYLQALNTVDKLNFDYKIRIDENGPDLKLSGNFGEQFVKAISTVANQIGNDVKKVAFTEINKQLNNASNEYLQKAKEFAGIKGDVEIQNLRLDNIQAELQKKINEFQKQVNDYAEAAKKQAEEAARNAAKQAAETAAKSAQNAVQQATNQAADAAKNMLKGLKK